MGDCLVTKFNGILQADIPILDTIKFNVKAGEFQIQTWVSSSNIISFNNNVDDIYIATGIIHSGDVVGATSVGHRLHGTLTRDTTFLITGLYSNKVLNVYKNNAHIYINPLTLRSILIYNKDTTSIQITSGSGYFHTSGFVLKLSDLVEHAELEKLIVYWSVTDMTVEGDISSLSNSIRLDTLGFPTGNAVTGTVESIVEGQVNAGRVSGRLTASLTNTTCTFNGLTSPVANGNLLIDFDASGSTVKDKNEAVLGTYINGTWTYFN